MTDTQQKGDMFPDSFSVTLTLFIAAQFALGLILNLGIQFSNTSQQIFRVQSGNFFVRTLGWIDTGICLTLMPCTFVVILLFPDVNVVLCAIHESIISMTISSTATCVLFISLDRYGAIVTPTEQRITYNNVPVFNAFIAVVSFLGFLFPMLCLCFTSSTNALTQTTTSVLFCRDLLFTFSPVYIYEAYFVSLGAMSTVTTTVCYIKIFKAARKRMNVRKAIAENNIENNRNCLRQSTKIQERRTLWITLAIIGTFFVSWGPYILVSVLQVGLVDRSLSLEMTKLCLLSLGMSSTVLHPIFYTFVNNNKRRKTPLRELMLEAGRDRIGSVEHKKNCSIVQNLVVISANQGMSVGINSPNLDIFTTRSMNSPTDETKDNTTFDNRENTSIEQSVFTRGDCHLRSDVDDKKQPDVQLTCNTTKTVHDSNIEGNGLLPKNSSLDRALCPKDGSSFVHSPLSVRLSSASVKSNIPDVEYVEITGDIFTISYMKQDSTSLAVRENTESEFEYINDSFEHTES